MHAQSDQKVYEVQRDGKPLLAGWGDRVREAFALGAERTVASVDTRHWFVGPRRREYHPVPVMGVSGSRESETRWSAIRRALVDRGAVAGCVVDVGAANGYYCERLARLGWWCYAVEGSARTARVLRYAARRVEARPPGRVIPVEMHVTPGNVQYLPRGDGVLLMAVWHHWVRNFGMDAATDMLRALWERTGRFLIFETGEREMGPGRGLPFEDDFSDARVDAWVALYLARVCPGGRVVSMGRHDASHIRAGATRGLWVVWRDPEVGDS